MRRKTVFLLMSFFFTNKKEIFIHRYCMQEASCKNACLFFPGEKINRGWPYHLIQFFYKKTSGIQRQNLLPQDDLIYNVEIPGTIMPLFAGCQR